MLRRLILTALLAASAHARADLPEPIARLLQAANIPEQALGAIVLRRQDGGAGARGDAVLLAHHAERAMLPASVMKLLTTAVGLERLGPTFRGRTELRSSAEVVNGVLRGDLILRGGADADFNADALEHLLEALRDQGIRTIRGDLILDRQLFQPARADLGAPDFDEAPEARYNVIPDALLLNGNLLRIRMQSDRKRIALAAEPALDKVVLDTDMALTDGDCKRWGDGWRRPETVDGGDGALRVVLHGSFPKNCTVSTGVNVVDRDEYVGRLFRARWKRLGGTLTGKVRAAEAPTPSDNALLAEHVARALPEVLRDINKLSDNTLARQLFLSLGSLQADAALGSSPLPPAPGQDTGARAGLLIRDWLRERGIDADGLVLDNGSGLSRTERLRPDQLAAVLRAAGEGLWAPEFLSSLPIAGLDGTMWRRLQGSPAALRARIKTGSLKNVVSVAGYAPDANGQLCVVVAIINHELAGQGGRAVLDGLIDWVAKAE